jgi:hypothetical protein
MTMGRGSAMPSLPTPTKKPPARRLDEKMAECGVPPFPPYVAMGRKGP